MDVAWLQTSVAITGTRFDTATAKMVIPLGQENFDLEKIFTAP